LPERQSLLDECRASVAAQTFPVTHLVGVDEAREGPSAIRNRLAAASNTDWLLPLDDDDLLDPDCVEALLAAAYLDGITDKEAAAPAADVIYPWCRVEGSTWSPNRLFRAKALAQTNFIPVTALISRAMWEKVGGWRPAPHSEDWIFWRDCLQAGATFTCVPEVLWTYRIRAAGTSRNEWQPAAPAKAA
jgi:glycosyltransferase involved in cell wall biosynthesis